MYADLGVVTKKKRSEAPEVDQHTVTYSTLDKTATSRIKASTMPAPSKEGSAEQGEGKREVALTPDPGRFLHCMWQKLGLGLIV